MTTFDDEFYRDILADIAVHSGSGFHRDILAALTQHQEPRLAAALNKNQMASKLWLADALFEAVGARLGSVLILGGWMGVLAAVLLHDQRFAIERIASVDIDPRCAPVALAMNATHVEAGRFAAKTADMLALDYSHASDTRADVVVNTSCEHLPEFDRWYARIPPGQLLVMQSNDYFAVAGHVNCAPDLATFRRQAPLATLQFAGQKQMRRYIRFMQIGFK